MVFALHVLREANITRHVRHPQVIFTLISVPGQSLTETCNRCDRGFAAHNTASGLQQKILPPRVVRAQASFGRAMYKKKVRYCSGIVE